MKRRLSGVADCFTASVTQMCQQSRPCNCSFSSTPTVTVHIITIRHVAHKNASSWRKRRQKIMASHLLCLSVFSYSTNSEEHPFSRHCEIKCFSSFTKGNYLYHTHVSQHTAVGRPHAIKQCIGLSGNSLDMIECSYTRQAICCYIQISSADKLSELEGTARTDIRCVISATAWAWYGNPSEPRTVHWEW